MNRSKRQTVGWKWMLYVCVGVLWMFLSFLPVVHALELTDENRQTIVSFAGKNQVLYDPDASLTPELALARITATGYESAGSSLAIGQSWIYTPLLNRSVQSDWVVRSNNTLFDELDFYLHCQGQTLQALL